VLTTLVGGFERNPPLYYEMRIARIKKDLAKNPNLIDEYDDIAVANDRIGNDDEAIKWIEAKKSRLSPLDKKSETSKDEWYRYYANCGTFWVHRWAHNGADYQKIDQVVRGQELIRNALAINPNAHFGREKYQDLVMSWLIDNSKPRSDDGLSLGHLSLANYVSENLPPPGDRKQRAQLAIIGLAGLIRLGGAWRSPDIYLAIGTLYSYPDQAMGHICALRAAELVKDGATILDKSGEFHLSEQYVPGPYFNDAEMAEYKRLRKLADDWNDQRQAFMLAKLKKGDHPDTDPHFWDGAPAMPDFSVHPTPKTWMSETEMEITGIVAVLALIAIVVGLIVGIVKLLQHLLRSKTPAA